MKSLITLILLALLALPAGASAKSRLVASTFTAPQAVYAYGAPLKVTYRLSGPQRTQPVRLTLRKRENGRYSFVAGRDLGLQPSNRTLRYVWNGQFEPGQYRVQIHISKARLRRDTRRPGYAAFRLRWGIVPLKKFSWGGAAERFGAERFDSLNRGQDLLADYGSQVLAPHGGEVVKIGHQASGYGHYVVIRGAGEERDYVLAHLGESLRVSQGQMLRTGQAVGTVGQSGAAESPRLRIEIWQGGWRSEKGVAIDPLPELKSWQ